jgi:hypothetical protein
MWLITLPSDCRQAAQRMSLCLLATSRCPHPLVESCVVTIWFCTGRVLLEMVFILLSDERCYLQTRSLHVEDLLVQRETPLIVVFHVVCSGRLITTSRSVTCLACKNDNLAGRSKEEATNSLLSIQSKNSLQWRSCCLLLKRYIVPSIVV